ncbi:MAG TPA: serine/threonine-protein kinase [Myxococcota bacterium]|nr:serine/threonine-protein kinase [Myxococcota bacterium]
MTDLGSRYRILRPIGRGGVGEVYEGIQTALDRRVAIKLLRPELTVRAEVVSRFEREARTTCRLQHPNVVTVFDVGVAQGGSRYLVMELLEGRTLAEVMRKDGPLQLEAALAIASQICRGMGAGQGVGLVHRDLKPENVMLLDEGRVKILDFGLATLQGGRAALDGDIDEALRQSIEMVPPEARSLETMAPLGDDEDYEDEVRPPRPPLPSESPGRLTRAGALVGTPRYMAPEQALCWEIDHRSDIYAFGVILYEMLAGRAPFEADSVQGYLSAHVHTPPQPPSLFASIPHPVEQLVLRCLAKDPCARFEHWAALSEELRRIQGVTETRAKGRERTPERLPAEPYRFLAPFSPSTSAIFFGRDDDSGQFLEIWESGEDVPLLALTGSSGVGKTSFLYARIVPALEDIGHEVLVVRGSHEPTLALGQAVTRRLTRHSGETEDRPLPMLLDSLAEIEGRPIAVVLDQLEELFTAGESEDQARFQADIASVVGAGERGVRFVFSIREDYLGQLLRTLHPLPVDQLLRTMPLRPLSTEDLEEALLGPGRSGLPVDYAPFAMEPGLAAEIVRDLVEDDAGEVAPRVQAVGTRLWEMVKDSPEPLISREHYRAGLGGAQGILGRILDEAIEDIEPGDRGLAKELLRALTHLPGSATSRPTSRSGLLAAHTNVEKVDEVLRRLESRWRIVQGYKDPRWPEERAYRIAHEALIARIQDYGEELSERNRARQLFRQGLELWLKGGKQEQDLLLDAHFEVVQQHVGSLVLRTREERAFYRQSHERNYDAWVAREITAKKAARRQRFWRYAAPLLFVALGWSVGQMPTDFAAANATWVRLLSFSGVDGAELQGTSLRFARLHGVRLFAADLSDTDLAGADLSGADLEKANLARASLEGTNLDGARLIGADLSEANLLGASFRQADLRRANLDADLLGSDFVGAIFDAHTIWRDLPPRGAIGPGADASMMVLDRMVFQELDLSEIELNEAHAAEASFRGCHMSDARMLGMHAPRASFALARLGGADLTGAELPGASFAGTELTNAHLVGADLSGASLVGAKLLGASLGGATLDGAFADAKTRWPSDMQPEALGVILLVPGVPLADLRLSGLDLTGAQLRGLDLSGAKLRGSRLTNADLSEAILVDADLREADLTGTNLSDADLSGADLRDAKTGAALLNGVTTSLDTKGL